MSGKIENGKTWADVVAKLPMWMLGIAALLMAGLIAHSILLSKEPTQLGFLGTWGNSGEKSPTGSLKNAVIAFNTKESDKCPDGWTLFDAAGGRTIIGAGQHPNSGLEEYPSYSDNPQKAVGGTPTVSLTHDQMPGHSHKMFGTKVDSNPTKPDEVSYVSYRSSMGEDSAYEMLKTTDGKIPDTGKTADAGGSQPHENMPPYIALFYCIKT